ncbi:hypothetical protein [Eubacterium callanderi]|uniref:hypothetical protein n=1 Tax=Eubacterium callanderi TaxID=53442 RepID=UPI001C0FDEFB|nr:hypothetical protein [Eubacterium callanderi]MBU5305179.1 hypothetical protein [Eubacterium callanderi]
MKQNLTAKGSISTWFQNSITALQNLSCTNIETDDLFYSINAQFESETIALKITQSNNDHVGIEIESDSEDIIKLYKNEVATIFKGKPAEKPRTPEVNNTEKTPMVSTSQTKKNQQTQNTAMDKEPWYKRNWFVILMLIFLPPIGIILMWVFKKWSTATRTVLSIIIGIYTIFYLFALFNPAQPRTQLQNATQTTPSATPAPTAAPTPNQYVNTAQPAELYPGTFTVGTDVMPGKYTITASAGSGNFVIKNKNGSLMTNEVLGDGQFGVTSVETYLADGDSIEISGIDAVAFTPTEPVLKTTLGSGLYLVGRDIPAGSYDASATSGSGNFIIYSSSGTLKTNEILGGDYGVSRVKVDLKDNDIVTISGIEEMILQ